MGGGGKSLMEGVEWWRWQEFDGGGEVSGGCLAMHTRVMQTLIA